MDPPLRNPAVEDLTLQRPTFSHFLSLSFHDKEVRICIIHEEERPKEAHPRTRAEESHDSSVHSSSCQPPFHSVCICTFGFCFILFIFLFWFGFFDKLKTCINIVLSRGPLGRWEHISE